MSVSVSCIKTKIINLHSNLPSSYQCSSDGWWPEKKEVNHQELQSLSIHLQKKSNSSTSNSADTAQSNYVPYHNRDITHKSVYNTDNSLVHINELIPETYNTSLQSLLLDTDLECPVTSFPSTSAFGLQVLNPCPDSTAEHQLTSQVVELLPKAPATKCSDQLN